MSNSAGDREIRSPKAGGYPSLFLYFILFMVSLSLLVSFLFNIWSGRYGEMKRNPHFRRAWAEHVMSASPKAPGEMLVIIISNSQGYGREIDDDETYAWQLEKILQTRHSSPVRVLNWSIPGGRAAEFPLLGAAANRLDPDAVILAGEAGTYSAFYTGLDEYGRFNKSWASDSLDLLGYPEVRRYMPEEYISEYIRPVDLVDAVISRVWSIWRYRDLPVSWLMRFKELRPFENKPKVETWFYDSSWRRKTSKSGRRRSGSRDLEMVDHYLKSIEGLQARKIYIDMPVMLYLADRYPDFYENVSERFNDAGGEAWDMSGELPNKQFVVGMHMNAMGNRAFARLIAERLMP